VDDDDALRQRLAQALERRGYSVRTAKSFDEGLALAQEESPELAVLDLKMPGKSGLDLLRELKAIDPTTKVVVLTGYGSIATAMEAVRAGAVHYLPKPADADEILAAFGQEASAVQGEARLFDAPSLARVEWEHIQRVLQDCQGNVSEAARRLGLHRQSLQRKLRKHPPAR
jgi:two-component system response regulator RegA